MAPRGIIVLALVCGACSRPEAVAGRPCREWGAAATGGAAVAMSDSVLRAVIRRDSAALAALSIRPGTTRGLLARRRSEPALFAAASRGDRRTVCVNESGDMTNVNIFFPHPGGRRRRTLEYRDEEHLALVWIRTDRWRLMTWTLWSRF
jgi:hypothetical protein